MTGLCFEEFFGVLFGDKEYYGDCEGFECVLF
jgi:hypothetical protein